MITAKISSKPSIKELKSKAMALKPIIQIGKKGLTKECVDEIRKQLKKNKLVKVKLLKPCLENKDKKSMAREIADSVQAELIGLTGFVVTLFREEKSKNYK